MSYTRSFSKTITVYYSGTTSYPPSEHGGTTSYSGSTTEVVHVNVHVDTDPFDAEIANCKHDVNLLTGAVVATEEAQVLSIAKNAKKVGKTIVDGFFRTVQSEITQQIAELQSRIDATLIHLHEMAKRCTAKQQQMTADYQRLCQRYGKLFQDLNTELENRIYMLDEPAFRFNRSAEALSPGTPKDDTLTVASIGHSETASAHSRIAASIAKRRAVHAIRQAHSFIVRQQQVDRLLGKVLMRDGGCGFTYAPAVFVESVESSDKLSTELHLSKPLANVNPSAINSRMASKKWKASLSDVQINAIRREYNARIAQTMTGSDDHERRVMSYMGQLFNLTGAKSLSTK